MNEKYSERLKWAMILVLVIGMFSFAFARSQNRAGEMERAPGRLMTSITPKPVENQIKFEADSFQINKPRSGQMAEDEFLVEPKTYVRMSVEILEIETSATYPIATSSIRIENGKPAKIIAGPDKESVFIQITPTIVAKKGITLKIEFQKQPEMKDMRSQEALVQNGETAVMELFENKTQKSKIGLKVTPLIEVVMPTKEYPGPVHELRLDDSYLIKNDDKLIARGNLAASSDQEDVFLWFLDDNALLVLGFKPFPGAVPAGYVQGTEIRIKLGQVVYEWTNRNPILPGGKWLVWVLKPAKNSGSLSIEYGQGILGKNGMIGIGTGKDAWKNLMKSLKEPFSF